MTERRRSGELVLWAQRLRPVPMQRLPTRAPIFGKGADFTASMAFELASTNMVAELAIILIVLMGWQFAAAEFAGAPLMVFILAFLFRTFLSAQLLQSAKEQDKGIKGVIEGHAEMDMSVTGGPLLKRILSEKGRTAISHYFVMDWVSIWKDIAGGLLITGALAAWVPQIFWRAFYLTSHPLFAKFWGPIVGPLIAIVSFVCSVGNVPLAGVLWNGGSSFGGVIAFLYADLIVLPILNIYRKYYGGRMSTFLLATMYVSMGLAALAIEFIFQALRLVPTERHAQIVETSIRRNYTTWLNIIFLAVASLLIARFLRTGGPEMLKAME